MFRAVTSGATKLTTAFARGPSSVQCVAKMSRAIQVSQFGGSDVMKVVDNVQPTEPQENEVG